MFELILVSAIFVFIIGLCIGSFLNVVALRGLSEESIVFPASKCPKCQTPIKWYDNIPLISYCILGGKCRNCKEHISFQYPLVEFSTAILFVFTVYYTFATSDIDTTPFWLLAVKLILLFTVVSTSILMIITDIKEKVVINSHFITFIISAFLYATLKGGLTLIQTNVINALIGLAVGALLLGIYMLVTSFLLKKQTLGEGDVWIAAGMGALLGWKYLLVTLCLSVVLCVIYILPLFLKRLIAEKKYLFATLFVTFFVVAIAFKYYVMNFEVYFDLFLIFVVALFLLGGSCAVMLIRMIKFKPESELLYLPFGPALLIATLWMTFYGAYTVKLIRTFLYLS